MQDLLAYGASIHKDPIFSDEYICATRTDSRIIQKRQQPYEQDGVYGWLDGEFYNRKELASIAGQSDDLGMSDLEILVELYQRDESFSFLQHIDGIYSAVIYDPRKQRVQLICDRYGLRHLFWTIIDGNLAWASEVKGMLGLPGFSPKIDKIALEDFLKVGNMLGNRTWFDLVQVLPASTTLTFDLRSQTVLEKRYWSWDHVRPLFGKLDETEILQELSDLFVAGVRRRSNDTESVGLTLSGGLDSRAILAAMPDHGTTIHAATFGKSGCDDIALAAAASKVKGATHHIAEIHAGNWLHPRVDGVWCTDGHLDLMHMHVIAVKPMIKKLFKISLDGFLGDAVIGGGYLGPKSQMIEKLDTRARRFIVLGSRLLRDEVESRFPFFDNRFLEMAISLPEEWLENSKIYRKMLIGRFPDFFKTIPWQKTGSPIRWPNKKEMVTQRYKDAQMRLLQLPGFWRLANRNNKNKNYEDYGTWMRHNSSRQFIEEVLTSPSAIYVNYLSRERVQHEVAQHMRGEEHSESIGRILTFEIWLQQVFEGRFRPNGEAN